MSALPSVNEMQKALTRRDASYDGIFFLAVRTTGVFCRPSCPARKPRPRNIEFFGRGRDALLAGYRPCKRCRPLDTHGRPPGWVERLLSAIEKRPDQKLTDADVRAMSIDPTRARRYFTEHYGMTFQAYHRARRLGRAFAMIRQGADLTDVALDHGYQSPSGFRDAFAKTFGGPPGRTRDGTCIYSTILESGVGPLLVAATDEALCLLEFCDRRALESQVEALRRRFDCSIVPGTNRHIDLLRKELDQYFQGKCRRFTVPLAYPGTPFQRLVWDALRKIPCGRTISYEELARSIGKPHAQRAVGRANGENRIAILIPCHRVVNKDGQLGGYGGGLWRKKFLLELEGADAARGRLDFSTAGEATRN